MSAGGIVKRSNEAVKISIADFDGPLDLLLHLIREQKLDIKTVKLAQVTAQYLEYLQQLESLDLDLASEFIEVGATLIEIKGKNILPRTDQEKENPEDAEQRLLRQIEEYKLLKEASEKLKPLENVDRFYKPPQKMKTEYKFVLDNLNLDELMSAFSRVLFKMEASAPKITETKIRMDRFTVADKIRDIRVLLGYCERVGFVDLFGGDLTRGEVINTFLALLELLKHQEVRAIQADMFGEIDIVKGDAFDKLQITNYSVQMYDTIDDGDQIVVHESMVETVK